MMYKKVVVDDLILGIGTVKRNGNITKKEYDRLAKIIHNKPEAPSGYYYVLHVDETWELIKEEEVTTNA